MVITSFSINDIDKKSQFFKTTFLLVEISMNVAFEIFFFILSNVKVNFIDQKLNTALDFDNETFIVYIVYFINSNLHLEMHHFCITQISLLKTNETSTFIFSEYADFVDIFSKDLSAKVSKHFKINNHVIDLIED